MNSDNLNSQKSISTSAPLFSSFPFLPELESFFTATIRYGAKPSSTAIWKLELEHPALLFSTIR